MGIGVKELIIVLLVAMLVGGLVALLLPREWVSLKAKRIILGVWFLLGLVQLIQAAARGGNSMFTYGLAEMLLAGGGLLILSGAGWKRAIGGGAIAVGLVLFVLGGAMSHTPAGAP